MKILRSILLLVSALGLALGFWFISVWGYKMLEKNRETIEKEKILVSRGVRTTAVITSYQQIYGNGHRPSKDENGTLRYTIEYSFDVGGKTYRGITYIAKTAPFDQLEIVYDPDFPENNCSPLQDPTFEASVWDIAHLYVILIIFVAAIYRWAGRLLRG